MEGMSLEDAALASGYAPSTARHNGAAIMKSMRDRLAWDMEHVSLTNVKLLEKYLLPALEAKAVKFGFHQGEVVSATEVVDWSTRVSALDMAFRLKGSYPARKDVEEDTNDGSIAVNITVIGNQQVNNE